VKLLFQKRAQSTQPFQ